MTRSLLQDIEGLFFNDSGSQTMGGGFIDTFNGYVYEHGEYCDKDTKLREPQKLNLFRDALDGTKDHTILLELSHVHKWDLEKLQEKLRMKEIKHTPHSHKSVIGAKQRRQGRRSASSENYSPKNDSHKVVPNKLRLPYGI